jgi:hypothetical protein
MKMMDMRAGTTKARVTLETIVILDNVDVEAAVDDATHLHVEAEITEAAVEDDTLTDHHGGLVLLCHFGG